MDTNDGILDEIKAERDRIIAMLARKKCKFHDAEDILQEVLISAFRKLERGELIEHPEAYLRSAARKRFMHLLRCRYRSPELLIPGSVGEDEDEGEHSAFERGIIDASPETTELLKAVASLVEGDTLSDRERCIIELYAYEDLSFACIAERLGLAKSTIHRGHRRAISKLRGLPPFKELVPGK